MANVDGRIDGLQDGLQQLLSQPSQSQVLKAVDFAPPAVTNVAQSHTLLLAVTVTGSKQSFVWPLSGERR